MSKPTEAEKSSRCAAVTRAGAACRNPVAPGQALCRSHASGAGVPQVAAPSQRELYDEGIGEEERRLWERISVTDLDAEIRIAKLQLKRLLAAQRGELDRRTDADEPRRRARAGGRPAAKGRPIDYDERVNRLLGRISDLVVTRAKLQREAKAKDRERAPDPAEDPIERLSRRIDRVALRMGSKAAAGGPDEEEEGGTAGR